MTATIIENDTEFFSMVNSEQSLACESLLDCGNSVEWCMKNLCCGVTCLVCNDCKNVVELWMDWHTWVGYMCNNCDSENYDYIWQPV